MEENIPLWQRPFRLLPNRVNYLLPGGELIDRFLGDEPSSHPGASQLWVASVVQSTLENAASSLSHIHPEDGKGTLAEALAARPALFLGQANAAAFGPNPGFLLKLLHSTQRLLVQTHPNRQQAIKYFGWPYGKTEAWYVLDTHEGSGPAFVWVGFKPGVHAEHFRALIEAQNTEQILNCLHRFAIHPGDLIYIPAGLPHALGANSLVAEIQEPTDITLRAERVRPDGSLLPWESLHSGAGMEALLACFNFGGAGEREAIRARHLLTPQKQSLPGGWQQTLIGPAQTDYFGLNQINCTGPMLRKNPGFRVLLVTGGKGELQAGETRLRLKRGTEMVLPAGVTEYRLLPQGALTLLECSPPKA